MCHNMEFTYVDFKFNGHPDRTRKIFLNCKYFPWHMGGTSLGPVFHYVSTKKAWLCDAVIFFADTKKIIITKNIFCLLAKLKMLWHSHLFWSCLYAIQKYNKEGKVFGFRSMGQRFFMIPASQINTKKSYYYTYYFFIKFNEIYKFLYIINVKDESYNKFNVVNDNTITICNNMLTKTIYMLWRI